MAAKLPPQPLGVPPGSSYWNDWYEKLRHFVDGLNSNTTGTGATVLNTSPTIATPIFTGVITTDGNAGITATITTAKITLAGTNGSMTFTNGILTAQTPAT